MQTAVISVFVIVAVILVQVTVVRAHLIVIRICEYIFNDLRHIGFFNFLHRHNVNTQSPASHGPPAEHG